MGKRGIAAALMAVGSVVLAGCGGAAAEPAPAETTAPPASGGSYGSIEELKDAFVAAGGECADFIQSNQVKLAAEAGSCSTNSVISTYLSSSDISKLIQNNKDLYEELGSSLERSPWLVGENWVINAPEVVEVREHLGGTLVSW